MRALVIFLLALSAAVAAYPWPGEASPYYPWCARYFDKSFATICSFDTKPQCMAEVSGRGGFCLENAALPPYQLGPVHADMGYEKVHRTKRHHHEAHH